MSAAERQQHYRSDQQVAVQSPHRFRSLSLHIHHSLRSVSVRVRQSRFAGAPEPDDCGIR